MARIKMRINFCLRAYEPRRDGYCPVEGRVYAFGGDMKFQTGAFCLPKEWDSKRQRVKPNSDDCEEMNLILANVEISISKAYKHHLDTGAPFNRENINTFLKGKEDSTKDFFVFAQERINEKKKLSPGTKKQLETELSKLKKFRAQVRFSDIDKKFILDYQKHMENVLGNNPNTVQKTMRKLSAHLTTAVDLGLLIQNPILSLSFYGCDPEEIEALEPEELTAVENCKLVSESLERTRKLFLLQCYTGLSYGDLKGLRPLHIKIINEKEYISQDRAKSDVNALPPLFPKAKQILFELNFYEKGKLDVWANQTYNNFIREVMGVAKVDKEISSHTARKTAGSIMLNDEKNPVSLEVVSRILGHKKISTTQRWYAKVKPRRIAAETENFKGFG